MNHLKNILNSIQRLEELGATDTLTEYISTLKAIKSDIEDRISVAQKMAITTKAVHRNIEYSIPYQLTELGFTDSSYDNDESPSVSINDRYSIYLPHDEYKNFTVIVDTGETFEPKDIYELLDLIKTLPNER